MIYTPPQPLCHDLQYLTPLHRATIAHLPQKRSRTNNLECYLTPTIASDPVFIPTDFALFSPILARPLPSPRNLETNFAHYEVVPDVAPHSHQTDDNVLMTSSPVLADLTVYVYST